MAGNGLPRPEGTISEPGATAGDGGWGRAAFWPHGARWRGVIWFLAIFCAYMGVALLYPFTETGSVSLLWMPNAVLVTALLRFRPRDWPYVYAAGLLAEVVVDQRFNVAPQHALTFGAVNVVEATLFVLFAALIAGGSRRDVGLLSVRGTVAVVLASLIVPAVTATLGATGSVWAFDSDYLTGWRTWWFGDGIGLLVGVPVGLLLRDAVRSVARRRSIPIALGSGGSAVLLIGLSVGLAAIGSVWGAQLTALAAAVLLSLTFGAVGAPVAAVAASTVTLVGLAQHDGFASAPQEQALLFVMFAAVFAVAATTESADRAMRRLSSARTELETAKTDLETANEWLASLLEAAPDAFIIVERDGRIAFANAQTDQMFGYPRADLVGSGVEKLLPDRFRDKHIRLRTNFFAEPTARPMGAGLELWGMRRDGTEFPVSINVNPLRTDEGPQVLAAIRDITERHDYEQRLRRQHRALIETQQELERLARFDSLTGLVNRHEAFARLRAALECARDPGPELGLLFCDVDHLKGINDTWGHAVGDVVLATVAIRIRECLRHGDTVGRTGGDEMLVLLPGVHNLEEVAAIAENIRSHAAEPIQLSGTAIQATLSIGATLAVPGESDSDTTARADEAMYRAKQAGRNNVIRI